jgi:prepilin-type N-terminal cleavage/methylation domain-containing protein
VASKIHSSASGRRDRGFTLIEMLIVLTVMGTLTAVISSVIIVALRSTPSAEARVDDARGVQSLVTWLPQDVDAAPPDGFNRTPSDWPCAGSAPSESYNVLSVRWNETAAGSTDFAASYRYENTGTSWRMARYYCSGTGPVSRNNLTSELPTPWNPDLLADPLSQPAFTLMCSSVVDDAYDGNCPVANRHPSSALAPSPVLSLKLLVDLGNGNQIMIDAAPKNPDQSLADDPNATANQPPTTTNSVISLTVDQNETKVFDLAPYFGTVDDPDGPPGDETALTVSIDPTEPLPSNLVSATTAYTATTQFELTLTAGPTLGTAPEPLMLIVSDERGGWKVVQAVIEVTDPPNIPPSVGSDHVTVGLAANQVTTVTLDVVTVFGVQDDAPLDQLTTTVTLAEPGTPPADPAEFAVAEVTGTSTIEVSFGPNIPASVGGFIEVYLDVTDAELGVLPLQLTIQIEASDTNVAPVAATPDVPITLEAGTNTTLDIVSTHGVTDSNAFDWLRAEVQSAPAGVTATASGTTVTITADASATVGVLSTPVTIWMVDIHGAHAEVTVSITVTAPPPPPSNCVLGSLSASPNPIPRQGGGGGAKKLSLDVTVTLTYTGTCDGLRLNYDSGDPSGLGAGIGRVFPPGSPSSIVIVGHFNGGTEQFTPGSHVLSASTTSAVSPNSIATTLATT